jgi:hypothetical protein
VLSNAEKNLVYFKLAQKKPSFSCALAENVILNLSESGVPSGILIKMIVEDNAGLRLAEFRRKMRQSNNSTSQTAIKSRISTTVS